MPDSYKLTTPFIFKTIRADENEYWPDFVAGLLGKKEDLRWDRENFTIRLGRPNAAGVRRYEIVPNKGKIPLFSAAEKQGFTKHQSTSYCHPSYYQPNYFGQGRRDTLVGMRFALKDVLLQRIMLYDGGTVDRPYDHSSREEAYAYLADKLSKRCYHEDLDSLAAIGRWFSWLGLHNEVMARLRAALDESMQVVVFTNSLEARLLAQARRLDLEKALKCPRSTRIPISFYRPLRYYTEVEQQKDIIQARSSKDSNIKALGLFLEKSQTGFKGLSSAEWDLIWPITHKLSYATRGEALIQWLTQLPEEQALKYLSEPSNTTYYLQSLMHSPACPDEIKRHFFSATRGHIINWLSKERRKTSSLIGDYFSFIVPCLTLDEKIALFNQTDHHGNNVLMLGVTIQPKAVSNILAVFESLPNEEKRKVILHTSTLGTILMHAPSEWHRSSTCIGAILDQLGLILTKEEIRSFLMQIASDGAHCLMSQASYHSNAATVRALLDGVVNLLDPEDVKSILKQTDSRGNNVLLIACEKTGMGSAATSILNTIGRLFDDTEAIDILKQTNQQGSNALMLAAENDEDFVLATFLTMAERLFDKKGQAAILKQVDKNDQNSLMIALMCKSPHAAAIFEAIERLDDEDKIAIFKQTNKWGGNILMLAARYHSSMVPVILTAIDRLFDEDSKIALLKKTDAEGNNALMLAAKYQSDSISPILRAIRNLSNGQDKRFILLEQFDKQGRHAFMLGSWMEEPYHLLEATYLLTDEERSQFLNQKILWNKKTLTYNLMHSNRRAKISCKKEDLSFQLGLLIKELEQQIGQYEKTDPTYYSQLCQMSQAIKTSFHHYQRHSEQDDAAAKALAQTCKTAMGGVNHRRGFPRDIQSILMGIMHIVGVLLLIGIPRAMQRHHQTNKSVFFTTSVERLTDRIETNMAALSKLG